MRRAGRGTRPPGRRYTRRPGPGHRTLDSAVIYIRNQALAVTHVAVVPPTATGAQLLDTVRFVLQLPPEVTRFGGAAGMRFAYSLTSAELAMPADPHAIIDVKDGATVNLEVEIRWFGPDGDGPPVVFRHGETPAPVPDASLPLLKEAFGHLMP